MTDRLYYRDPALLTFDATIVESKDADNSVVVRLDRSAFYPTSGGQSHDLGMLGNATVTEVFESEDGEVWHRLSTGIGAPGTGVKGQIEPTRRLKNRQQHSAQHILSALFAREYQLETVSVHLGDDYGAIELSAASLDSAQLARIELLANQIVFDSSDVEIMFAESDQLASIPLRKPPDRSGQIRIIRIGDLDWSACGGTHCHRTSEIGIIKLIGSEKIRNRILIKFLAGTQALQDYSVRFDVTDNLSRALTCAVTDLPGIVTSLGNDNKSLRKEITALQKELLPIRAHTLAASAEPFNTTRIVTFDGGADSQLASQLAATVADQIEGLALCVADNRLLIAVSANSGLHAGDLAKQLGARLNLRGGGSNRQAQLGGATPSQLSDYKEVLRALIPHA